MNLYIEDYFPETDHLTIISINGVTSSEPSSDFHILDALLLDSVHGVDVMDSKFGSLWQRLSADYPTLDNVYIHGDSMIITTTEKVPDRTELDTKAYLAELISRLEQKIANASPNMRQELTSKRDLIAPIM